MTPQTYDPLRVQGGMSLPADEAHSAETSKSGGFGCPRGNKKKRGKLMQRSERDRSTAQEMPLLEDSDDEERVPDTLFECDVQEHRPDPEQIWLTAKKRIIPDEELQMDEGIKILNGNEANDLKIGMEIGVAKSARAVHGKCTKSAREVHGQCTATTHTSMTLATWKLKLQKLFEIIRD